MDPFLQMHIFFLVTTIVVVALGVLSCVALVYLILLFRTVERIANHVNEEAEEIRADLDDVRRKAKREGLRLGHLITFFGKTAKRAKKKRTIAD
ncbi:MAG: hypothetical protein AB203_02945 [Parcubacteria bacterium C7867-008]|nr:MAG: hypothetical protein AB203_02945 [Parcubacteria bacterium C7867-008]